MAMVDLKIWIYSDNNNPFAYRMIAEDLNDDGIDDIFWFYGYTV